jgi:hypothetical protein
LFPLKAYWDGSPAVIDAGMYNLPEGSGESELVAVKYPAEGGRYTAGDTGELYAGKDGRIEYEVYQRGGAPAARTSWADRGIARDLVHQA